MNKYIENTDYIKNVREAIKVLSNKDFKELLNFEDCSSIVEVIIFDKDIRTGRKKIFTNFELIKGKFDFTGVSWDNVDIRGLDFRGAIGVKINLSKVYEGSRMGTIIPDDILITDSPIKKYVK